MDIQYKSFFSRRCFGVEAEFGCDGIEDYEMFRILTMADPNNMVTLTGYDLSDGTSWNVRTVS